MHLPVAAQVEIEEIEKVQRRATNLIKGLKKNRYEERLRKLRLPTLKYRRIRGNMIEVYKVISGKYDSSVSVRIPTNEEYFTRGNKYKLIKDSFRLDIRKYSFSYRIVNIGNSLPNQVAHINSIDLFKACLDNFYQRVSIASYANRWYSQRRNVRPSVRHTPVLYQNEES